MNYLTEALAKSIDEANSLFRKPDAESIEDVFSPGDDTYQRFNAAWHEGRRRESKEGSP